MPYVPPLVLANGNALDWTEFETLADSGRDYLNAIPAADIGAEAIDRIQIVEPLVFGFPAQRLEGEAQSGGWHRYGHQAPPGQWPESWGARPQRIMIVPRYVADEPHRTVIGTTITVSERPGPTHEFELFVTGTVQVRSPPTDVGGMPMYPTGGGAGDLAGYLAIERYIHSTGERDVYTDGAFELYPQEILVLLGGVTPQQTGFYHDRFHVLYTAFGGDALVGGETYTFTLVYVRDTCPAEVVQIDLSEIQMSWSLA